MSNSHAGGGSTATAGGVAGPALDVVLDLSTQLRDLTFPLELPGVAAARSSRQRIDAQLTTHLVPRLRNAGLPAVVVVGGPTGAGKSTLVNAVAGAEVSAAGVVRPTTRRPVLVVNPADAELVRAHPVAARSRVVVADVPRGLALLDAPDLDSVDADNRTLAIELVEAADVWLFVTTANRYGDALPWAVLDQVRRRGITVGVVLDRVGRDALDVVRRDLLARLDAMELGSVPLFIVPDAGPLTGPLDPDRVGEVSSWLRLIATRAGSREVVARTIRGVWSPLRAEVRQLLDAVVAQVEAAGELRSAAEAVADAESATLRAALRDGVLAHGAPTARWLAGAGSRGPLEPLAHDVTGFLARRRVARSGTDRAAALAGLRSELRAAFDDVVGQAAHRVADGVRAAWGEHSDAGLTLATARASQQATADRVGRLDVAWHDWVQRIGRIERAEGGSAPVSDAAQTRTPLLDADGERTLLALAAAGLTGARTAVRRLVPGEAGERVVLDALAALEVVAGAVLSGEADAFAAEVSGDLAPEAAAALRIRVGELRRLAGEDR